MFVKQEVHLVSSMNLHAYMITERGKIGMLNNRLFLLSCVLTTLPTPPVRHLLASPVQTSRPCASLRPSHVFFVTPSANSFPLAPLLTSFRHSCAYLCRPSPAVHPCTLLCQAYSSCTTLHLLAPPCASLRLLAPLRTS